MKAIILSAGEGSRMRPLTLTKPKTMLPVAGKPIIQYNIESLRDNGIKDILLIVRYKEEMVRDYFGDGSDFGVNITYKTQKDFLGTANAISYGKDFINDSLIVLNGDIILDNDVINEFIHEYENSNPDTLMLLTEVENPSAFGVVEIEDGNIKSIVEKPKLEEAPSNLVNAGIYIFNRDIFDKIEKTEISERGEYEITDSVSLQIADGKKVIGHKTNKDWIDVGRPWELIEVNEELIGKLKTEIQLTRINIRDLHCFFICLSSLESYISKSLYASLYFFTLSRSLSVTSLSLYRSILWVRSAILTALAMLLSLRAFT